MNPILLFVCLVFVAGILFVCSQFKRVDKGRDEFLKEIEKFLGAAVLPIQGKENCFYLPFNFEGEDFVFEYIEEQGFNNTVCRAALKVKMPGKFNFAFLERSNDLVRHSSVLEISGLDRNVAGQKGRFKMPKALELFDVATNDAKLAQKILSDKELVHIFSEFSNIKGTGYPFVSLRIVESELVLEFHPKDSASLPNLSFLYSDVSSLEDYCLKMLKAVKRLKWIL